VGDASRKSAAKFKSASENGFQATIPIPNMGQAEGSSIPVERSFYVNGPGRRAGCFVNGGAPVAAPRVPYGGHRSETQL
jgi:hypothetical protein